MQYSKQCALIYQNALARARDEMMSVCMLPVEFLAINLNDADGLIWPRVQ
jgi:hypothetical protein